MRDCTYCLNHRTLTNARGEEVRCPMCSPRGAEPVKVKEAMRAAIAAVEKERPIPPISQKDAIARLVTGVELLLRLDRTCACRLLESGRCLNCLLYGAVRTVVGDGVAEWVPYVLAPVDEEVA